MSMPSSDGNSQLPLPPRLLALLPLDLTPVQAAAMLGDLATALQASLGHSFQLVSSTEWYKVSFTRSGSWDAWIWETVTGRDYGSRSPRFIGFVVCADRLGRGAAGIVKLALQTSRPVLAWQGGTTIHAVRELSEQDSSDWQGGWIVRSAPLGG